MSELKFKVGDLLADDLGAIGEILGITPESEFPYRIREVDGICSVIWMHSMPEGWLT